MTKAARCLAVRRFPWSPTRGLLTFRGITFPCALGRSGTTHFKHEGDGATPIGSFELLNVYYRADRGRRPTTGLPVEALAPEDGWCDEPAHPRYNRPIELPFAASHEKMWRDDRLYDIVVVLDYNMYPAVPGRGSAIFFHIAREGYAPTEGCIAVSPQHMRRILAKARIGDVLRVF